MLISCRARREERRRSLPGDDLVPAALGTFTHAVTIGAPPAMIWPWLAQLGAGRAGWYSWDLLDNGGRPSAHRLLAEHQRVGPGDLLPALPGARDAFIVHTSDPPRTLVLVAPRNADPPSVSWSFHLVRAGRGRTRLIARARASAAWRELARNDGTPAATTLLDRVYRVLARLPAPLLVLAVGIGHWIMEGRMLRGIKRRCEDVGATGAFSRPEPVARRG